MSLAKSHESIVLCKGKDLMQNYAVIFFAMNWTSHCPGLQRCTFFYNNNYVKELHGAFAYEYIGFFR